MGRSSKGSLLRSTIMGAVGAFIFWGVFAGWFSVGETGTQLAAPAAQNQTGEAR